MFPYPVPFLTASPKLKNTVEDVFVLDDQRWSLASIPYRSMETRSARPNFGRQKGRLGSVWR